MNMKTNFLKKKLGILGGGQLGKMLINVARKWSIQTYILDPNPDCPASKCCDLFFNGAVSYTHLTLPTNREV